MADLHLGDLGNLGDFGDLGGGHEAILAYSQL